MRPRVYLATALLVATSSFALAQEKPAAAAHAHEAHGDQQAMMAAWEKAITPNENHKLLDYMVGTWDTTIRFWMEPGGKPEVSSGTSTMKWILGNRWVEQRFKGTAMGQPFEGIGYSGYDNLRKEYVGTWMDSMSTGVMTSSGKTTDGGKTWLFTGEMSDPMSGKSSKIEERAWVKDADNHGFEMWGPGPDGKVFKTMEIIYTRKK